jgi:heme exporter protein D
MVKPSWGQATFVVSAIALAVACVVVLGVSVYVLARIWRDTLKERRRKKEVKL